MRYIKRSSNRVKKVGDERQNTFGWWLRSVNYDSSKWFSHAGGDIYTEGLVAPFKINKNNNDPRIG